jgi:hypothetical protein
MCLPEWNSKKSIEQKHGDFIRNPKSTGTAWLILQ